MHTDTQIESRRLRVGAVLTPILLFILGFLAWTGLSIWGGLAAMGYGQPFYLREAWDMASYAWLALPAMMIVAGTFGYMLPERVWRWPAWLIGGHLAGVVLISLARGSGLGLLPFTIVLLTLLALLLWLPALIGKALARIAGRT